MTEPAISTFTDTGGDVLEFKPEHMSGMPPAVYLWPAKNSVRVTPADLPEVVTKLYEATGRPVPIILDRPEIIPTCRVPVPDGLVEAQEGRVIFLPANGPGYIFEDAPALAAALGAVHEHIVASAENARVADLAQALRDANPSPEEWESTAPHLPVEAMARNLLRRFNITEREAS